MSTKHDGHLHHISQQFNSELSQLKAEFLKMGGMVESQVQHAMQALENNDYELAEQTRLKDKEVDRMERAIDEEANRVIVKRQPTASDLRLVMSVVKMVADLERIGDEAKKIAKFAISISESETGALGSRYDSVVEAKHISNHVVAMVRDALDAFARFDTAQALRIMKEDKLVDQEYKSAIRSLVTFMMEDPRSISTCLSIMWVLRSLERVGDHACNIAEYVIYMVEGEDVRHRPIDHAEKVVRP
ncbi:MAG TPA: phosphate signaling complex protein PhoU [Pseudomonas xinjiangensis]|uniref:Phosphate-specific transport system accessory protein PhoU n=2 Tax=root TaxID=1 RepID=A0A7V1FTS3_9GAMM|nr:phosphate signaling complex protein PhoU [Halopseudomonas xinjiangensis]HEC47013.1 phosphate signaling complex protein PhoU [Halopseudomonas xinjiangensis]